MSFFFNHIFISSLFLAGGGERKGEGRKKVFGWVDRKNEKGLTKQNFGRRKKKKKKNFHVYIHLFGLVGNK